MHYAVLGPIEAAENGRRHPLGGQKQRTVLALLIAQAGRQVTTGQLIDGVYGDDQPKGARRSIQTYVSNLRGVLGDVIRADGSGYLLSVERQDVDALRFEDAVAAAGSDDDPDIAATTLRAALSLWRGVPYADVDAYDALSAEITRLNELHITAIEQRIEADLAMGRHHELIAELESLTREHPLRERLCGFQMLALYRSGRQAEALRAYELARIGLVDGLGLDPSAALRELEQRILEQDPELDVQKSERRMPNTARSAIEVRFARDGDVHIAYHVVGDGPVDIVYVEGGWSHLEVGWELPAFRAFCEQLGEFSRVIIFDKSGMGMSDRVPGATPLDVRMDDIRAVMDDVGSESAALIGASEGGPLCMLFAAAHPERTAGLILMGGEVRERRDDQWPWGEATEEEFEAAMATLHERWGKPGRFMEYFAPSQEETPWLTEWSARLQSNANTPGGAEAFMRMAFDIDVRDIASSIRVPTLILHSEGDRICHVENGRFLAREISNSRYVELPGADHIPWFEPDRAIAEIRDFLTGQDTQQAPEWVLATVLHASMVGSTARTVGLGDDRSRQEEAQVTVVRGQLERFRGVEVDTPDHGFLATFDGPTRAIHCAREIQRQVERLGLEMTVGVHTGEVERAGDGVAGIVVRIGAQIAALAEPGEVLVSGTVRDLVSGSGLTFVDRDTHELRGVAGQWRVFAASD